ncbi:hypothetical protein [Thermus sp.]|uniref:hypothetical protein n=1 Tax=Thermus sp. TaxID=275 RepID=UPI003D14B880
MAKAKRFAADVRFGQAPREALLAYQEALADPEFAAFLERVDPRLLRYLRMGTAGSEVPPDPEGKDLLLYLAPLPGERQLRAAYEVALEGFLEYLEAQGYPIVERGTGWVKVYVSPKAPPLDLERAWKAYIEQAFSLEGLSARLLPLLNSVRLAGRGISAPKVPLPTLGARDFLAAWYLANLLSVKERLAWRDQEISRLEEVSRLLEGSEKTKKLRELEKRRQDQEKERRKYGGELQEKWEKLLQEEERKAANRRKLEERLQRAKPKDKPRLENELQALEPPLPEWALKGLEQAKDDLGQLWVWLDPESPKAPEAIQRLKPYLGRFGPLARGQLNTAVGNKFTKILEEFLRLLSLSSPDAEVPPLVSQTPFALPSRQPGDKADVCYGCGRPLGKGKHKASKLVFASPSQRLQSGSGQEEPWVCPSCAALALLSPIKPGEGSVLVRVGDYGAPEAAKHFARLLVTGTLHVAAGRYLLLNSPQVGGKSLAQALGRVVYALQALGQEVNPRVLERFPFYLVEGAQEIPLPPRALWLSYVLQKAFDSRPIEGNEPNRSLGEALRYALSDLPWHALYTLARRYGWVDDRFSLEDGLAQYASLLEKGVGMKENTDLSQRFRDVAGLTGLLSAWVGYVESQVGRNAPEAKGAVRKLLDNLERPGDFLYVAAYYLNSTQARLYEASGTFFYQEAKRLLQEAGARVQEAEEDSGRFLTVSQDDLHRVYTHLAAHYPGKAWEGFIYEVRLSLASRFPQYIRMEKEG